PRSTRTRWRCSRRSRAGPRTSSPARPPQGLTEAPGPPGASARLRPRPESLGWSCGRAASGSAAEGAGTAEHPAVPAPGRQQDRPRVVLEEPATEVPAGPAAEPGDPHGGPGALAVAQRPDEEHRHLVVGHEGVAGEGLVAAGDGP